MTTLRFLSVLAPLVALAASTPAAERYVSRSGSDANPGTLASPFLSIQKAVNLAVAGDTVWLREGTWRESVVVAKTGTAAAPILISAYPGERPVLKGSQIVSGWTAAGIPHVWMRSAWTIASQQVFVDDVHLAQIGVPSSFYAGPASDGTTMIVPVGSGVVDLVPGSFFYDAVAQALYVRLADDGDPNAHLVEASTAQRIMMLDAAAWCTVRGVTFRHSATAAFEQGGAAIELGNACTLDQCDIQWCDFAGVSMGYRHTGARVTACVVSNNGDSGIGASSSYGFAVLGCTIQANNYRGFNTLWHAGGIKCTSNAYGTVEDTVIAGNAGQGVWFDYCVSGQPSLVHRCHISGNAGANGGGVMVEASADVVVADNVISDNDRRGVYVSASDRVSVWMNTISGTRTQSAIDVSGMPRAGKTLTDIDIANNIVTGNLCQNDLMMVKENGTDILRLHCDYNLFYRGGGAVALWSGLDGRGGWVGTRYASVAAWQAATGLGGHCLQADPMVASNGTLSAGSPAIDAGSTKPLADDYLGNPRPAAAAYDLGAYEFGSSGGTRDNSGSAGGSSGTGTGTGSIATGPVSGIGGSTSATSAGAGKGCGMGSGLALAMLALALAARNAATWLRPRSEG